ncbi:hypothetical protein L917_08795, partial [Phytophthora nicotianae]
SSTKIPVETFKSIVLAPSVAKLIGETGVWSGQKRDLCISSDLKTVTDIILSIRSSEHRIPTELQRAIVAEALKKKIRHGERGLLGLARCKQMQVEAIEDFIVKVRSEIQDLESKCSASARLSTWQRRCAVVLEYFRQLNRYISSPGMPHNMASKFLHKITAPDVMGGSLCGVRTQLESWAQLTNYFDDVNVRLKGLKNLNTGALVADTVTSVFITINTLRLAFPHLNSDGVGGIKGGTWSPIAGRMLDKRLVMHGTVAFGWDITSGKLDSIHWQTDMMTPMLALLGI